MNKKKIKKILAIVLSVVIVVASCGIVARALIDESNSVKIKADSIEDSTMIIGTHLIYIGSMNDAIYETAQQSAEQSSQYNQYYKSELADGAWFDITDASSLEDITTAGKPVGNSVIEALNFTHHTKSDGITYDLLTNKPVSVFDINSPYKLEGLEEFNPLKLQYENLQANENKTETDERNIQLIRDFYSLDFTDDNTKECDEALAALQTYYEKLKKEESEAAMCDIVQDAMSKIDAQRRAQIFFNIQIEALDNLNSAISRNKQYDKNDVLGAETSGEIGSEKEETTDEDSGEEEEDNTIDGFTVDNNLQSAISEVIANVEESYNTNYIKMLDEGTTVLSNAEYQEIQELIKAAKRKSYVSCDQRVMNLIYIDCVNTGTIKNQRAELTYINRSLLPVSKEKYYSALSAGESAEYKALPSTAAVAVKQQVLKEQKSQLEEIRTEYEFITQAKLDRMSAEEAKKEAQELLEDAQKQTANIKDDNFSTYAKDSLDSLQKGLNEAVSDIQNQSATGEMDALLAKKEQLLEEKQTALDKDDLKTAKQKDAMIEAVDKQIEALEGDLNKIINSSTASEAEKALARAELAAGTATGTIQDLVSQATEGIKNGQYDDIENLMNSICGFAETNPQSVTNALKDIYASLTSQQFMNEGDKDKLDDLITKTENAVVEHMPAIMDGLSESDLSKVVADYFDLDVSELNNTNSDKNSEENDTENIGDNTGESNTGNNGEDNTENSGEDNTGNNGEDNTGNSGEDNTGNNGESSTANNDESDTGNSGENNTGSTDTGNNGESDTGDNEEETTESPGDSPNGTGDNSNTNDDTQEDPLGLDLILGGDSDVLSADECGVVLTALQLYYEQTKSEDAKKALMKYGAVQYNKNNPNIYEVYKQDTKNNYIPLDRAAFVLGYRYIFNDSQKEVTLQKGKEYYIFKAFSKEVKLQDNKKEEMEQPAGYQNTLYIHETYVKEKFGIEVMNLEGTNYAMILADVDKSEAQDLCDYFIEVGGV